MDQAHIGQDLELQTVLDRVGITPQQLFDVHRTLAERVASTPEWLDFSLQRSPGLGARPLRSWHINPDALDSKLRNLLDGLGVGFCYMLTRRGAVVLQNKRGAARLATPAFSMGVIQIAADPGVDWDFGVQANLCSVSKVITAIATVMLLRDRGIDPATPVKGFLPKYWARPASIADITFRDLLRHESGLGESLNVNKVRNTNPGPGDYANARDQFERGSTGTGLGTFDYKNVNYTILRAAFPIVAELIDPSIGLPGFNDTLWHAISATVYRDFTNDRVFAPAGVGPFDLTAGPDAARAYGTPPSAPGAQLYDVTSDAGSSGWHLSLSELMRVVAKFRHSGSMMSTSQAQQLLASQFGIDTIDDCNAGAIYAKQGRFNDGGANTLDTAIYLMPDDLELGVFINSGPGSGPTQPSYNATIAQLIIESAEAS